MTILLVFVLGTILGSFLNVCIYRLPKGESIVVPGSHCPKCKTPIHWYDNIPILSYMALKGRCRQCGFKIPFRYFVVELLTGIFMAVLFVTFGVSAKFLAYAILLSCLTVATFVDFQIQEIPDEVSLGGLAVGLLLSAVFPSIAGKTHLWHGVVYSLAGALAGGGSIYVMGFIGELIFKKEAMGGGDVKLMAMIGAFLGWKLVLLTFFIAPLFGSIIGIFKKLRYGSQTIPYGPYLSLAAVVALWWGEDIIRLLSYGCY